MGAEFSVSAVAGESVRMCAALDYRTPADDDVLFCLQYNDVLFSCIVRVLVPYYCNNINS